MTDGKYCTLALLKQYLIGTTAARSGNTTVFNQGVINTPDDNILSDCILQAESSFESLTGSGYDQQTYSLVQALSPFVDGNSWIHLFARERGPVTAVTAIQYMDVFDGDTSWTPLTWNATSGIILPPFAASDTHPHPESWHVMIYPNPALSNLATGQVLVQWSYTAGFSSIPPALQMLVARMAQYIYKLREMPAGKVVNQPLGTMTVPTNFPPDILKQIMAWSPVYG